jgi:hypothetical protein
MINKNKNKNNDKNNDNANDRGLAIAMSPGLRFDGWVGLESIKSEKGNPIC